MKRQIIDQLLVWKSNPQRKPLILNGARQVGKTYILKHFGKTHYEKCVYINCDNNQTVASIFEGDYNMPRILLALSAYSNTTIEPHNTLIIFDEVQENPQILNALKYFCEDAPDYHVAVAGSLLGISLHSNQSFPVGKVDMLRMYPMTFTEFLWAIDKEQLADLQTQAEWNIINSLSETYIDCLRQYYFVGGMPAVVQEFVNTHDLKKVRSLQKDILFNYARDFSKHAPAAQVPRIRMVWEAIPAQLAKENKKFIYGALRKGARASEFELAIQWLIDAGLVYRIHRVSEPQLPLKFYEDLNAFKLFMLDVGLMGAMADSPASAILVESKLFTEYKGAFTELYALTQLLPQGYPIYYYSAPNSQVEVDFLVQKEERIIPIEVKAEENVHAKSLRTFIENNPTLHALRLSMKGYIGQDWMENRPLYAPDAWLKESK